MNHIDIEDMAAYVAGRIKGNDALQMEKHLEACPECKRRVRTHHYIRNNFDQVWEAWTAKKRRENMLAARTANALFQSLRRTLEINLKNRNRIESWIERLRSDAGIAWCAAVDSADKVVRVVRERLDELPPLVADIALRPLGAPVAIKTRGAVRTRGKGKELRGRGETQVITTLTVERLERPGGCSIRVKAPLLEKPWPLVMLMPETEGESIVQDFKKMGEGLIADFKDLPDVQYYIVVEGSAKKKVES